MFEAYFAGFEKFVRFKDKLRVSAFYNFHGLKLEGYESQLQRHSENFV